MNALLLLAVLGPSPFIVPPPNRLAASGVISSGATPAACTGDQLVDDNNGKQDCQWTADTVADSSRDYAHSASPVGSSAANRTGAAKVIAGGIGSRYAAVTAASFVNNTTTITFTLDGTANVGTEGTAFECSSVTDAVCATNIAAWADSLTGIDSCAGAGCTGWTGVSGTFYGYRAIDEPGVAMIDAIATSTGAALTITTGANGPIMLWGQTADGTGPGVCFGGTVAAPHACIQSIQSNSNMYFRWGDGSNSVTINSSAVSTGNVTSIGKISSTIAALVLNGATTLAATRNVHTLDCTGAETLTTITGGVSGMQLTLICIDAECTVTDTDDGGAGTIDLQGTATNLTSAADVVVHLIHDGTAWLEMGRVQN